MHEKRFLYRRRDDDDRDACVYIENPDRWECGHYFGGLHLQGSCFCGGRFDPYDDIETVLTRDEYQALMDFEKAIDALGFGIHEGDERWKRGRELIAAVMPIWDKLGSEEAQSFANEIFSSEDEWLIDEYGFDEDDLETIWDNYYLPYHDRSVIQCVYDDAADLGYDEALDFGYIRRDDPISMRYFDYEKFGEDLLEEERYVELRDGRVVCLSY